MDSNTPNSTWLRGYSDNLEQYLLTRKLILGISEKTYKQIENTCTPEELAMIEALKRAKDELAKTLTNQLLSMISSTTNKSWERTKSWEDSPQGNNE